MRFKVTLEILGKQKVIPVNYQYELSAWIYKTIHHGDAAFAEWLHAQGYSDGNKQFKLFTFSNLALGKYAVSGDRIEVISGPLCIDLNFYTNEAAEPFITGLFREQEFTLGDRVSQVNLRVNTIEKMPEPEWKPSMIFRTASPIVIGIKEHPESTSALYISPERDGYGGYFIKNLVAKYMAVMNSRPGSKQMITFSNPAETRFKLLSMPRPKIITIKAGSPAETRVKGFLYDFELSAPENLMKLGYYAGFGEKNSLGFGCVKVREKALHLKDAKLLTRP